MLWTVLTVPAFAAGTNSASYLTTNKTEYKYEENIIVTASGGTNTAWVGVYNKGDVPGNGAGADCIMYWADEEGEPLEGYTPLAKFRLKGEVTEHDMYDYTIIPEGAKILIAYLSSKGALIGDPVSTELPEGCNYIIEDDYNMEFQLISDIHINQGNHAYNTHFTQMLDDVRVNSPDSIGIFVNGDIADHGKESEYERLLSLYDAVKNKGRIPEIHMAIGNHDWSEGNSNGRFQKYVNKLNPEVETETVY